MTRINLIAPKDLTDQHLFAEFREITRIFTLVQSAVAKHGISDTLKKIPSSYRLGTGHVLFFYDKLGFIEKRYFALKEELIGRDYQFTPKDSIVGFRQSIDPSFYKDYTPTKADLTLSIERLLEKIAAKPQWYRKQGNVIDDTVYQEGLKNLITNYN